MKIVQVGGFNIDVTEARDFIDQLLARPLFAHLATASEYGPRDSPVWFLWEHETLWVIGNRRTDSFPKRIERDPRCAIGIVDFDQESGLVQHVGFRGRARLDAHDEQRMSRLLGKYLGQQAQQWDPRFLAVLGDEDWLLVRFTPETVIVRDQSYRVK